MAVPDSTFRKYTCFFWADNYILAFVCLYRISEYMDLTPAEVVGHTCYHFIHVEDLENLRQSHEDCESQPHAYAWNSSPTPFREHVNLRAEETSFHPAVIGAICCWTDKSMTCFFICCLLYIVYLLLPLAFPSAEERSGGDWILPLASEEGGLPVDPVQCHSLH